MKHSGKVYPSVSDEVSQRSLAATAKAVLVNSPDRATATVLGGILTQLTILNGQVERLGDLLEAKEKANEQGQSV